VSSTGSDPGPLPSPLRNFAEDPEHCALLSDFDGTLAEIVPSPQDARPFAGVPQLLSRLSEHLGLVGVISGRPASFLSEHLATAGSHVRLIGQYGLQWFEGGEIHTADEAQPWIEPVSSAVRSALESAPPGIFVEDKQLAVSLHWRQAPQYAEWAEEFANRISTETGLLIEPGRQVIELRPPLSIDKGVAVAGLAGDFSSACFIGDDSGDLAAFDALDRLSSGRECHTVKIAVSSTEGPAELARRADIILPGPASVADLFTRLLQAVA
jgi:trehalose 6-phosphate phosphatase